MEELDNELIYNFVKVGSFGKFYAGTSFPIEFVQTSFSVDELEDLTFARDVRPPDNIDFDLLIQRDIDEERVRKEIEPYLNPKKTAAENQSKAVYFPPLLAAIIPIKEHKMSYLYPDENGIVSEKFLERVWPGLFQLKYFLNDGPQAYPIDTVIDDVSKQINTKFVQSEIKIRLVKGGQLGAKLVVIDGQHRLSALKSLAAKDRALIENLAVPVCILFCPNSTEFKKNNYPVDVPTVPEVFRHLFVDVNKTMELVGGHFNILLSDDSISSLACRRFCDDVLKTPEYGQKGLAVIEWNTKSAKESTRIQRPYSIASVGILDQAMAESLGESKYLTSYLLNLPDKEEDLYPENDDVVHPKVDWSTFSLTQKKILDEQVKSLLVPSMKKIFFESDEYKRAYNVFLDELSILQAEANSDDTDVSLEARGALNQILEYIPIGASATHDKSRNRYRKFELAVKDRREKEVSPIIGYAIFQRGIFFAWGELLKYGRIKNVDVDKVSNALVELLNLALKDRGHFFAFDKEYIQHGVYDGSKIKPKHDTRKAIGNLILALLGTKNNAKKVLDILGLASSDEFIDEIVDFGQIKASEYIKHFEKERKRSFKGSYRVDFSIDKDDREELAKAEEEHKRHLKEVREGVRKSDDVSTDFEKMMNDYVSKDVEIASKMLKDSLSYSSDIIGFETNDDSSGE